MTGQEMGQMGGRTDRQTDGGMNKAITICLPQFLWGHKNSFVKKAELMIAENPVCIYSSSLYKAWNRRPVVGVLL